MVSVLGSLISWAVAGATNAALAANAIVTNAVRSIVAPSRGLDATQHHTRRRRAPAAACDRIGGSTLESAPDANSLTSAAVFPPLALPTIMAAACGGVQTSGGPDATHEQHRD